MIANQEIKRNQVRFCRKCILTDGFLSIKVDEEQELCDFCRDPGHIHPVWYKKHIGEREKTNGLKDWNETVSQLKKMGTQREYDCVLGYSGGKDSTALLEKLINEYGLKPLLITIQNGNLPDIAKENINKTIGALGLKDHHFIIENAIPSFNKLYRYLFLNHKSRDSVLTTKVCDACADLMHSILVKEALKRNISIVILGYSSDQIRRYFYEIPEEHIRYDWYPEFLSASESPFNEEDRTFFMHPDDTKGKTVPRVLLPYHVLEYDEEAIIAKVNQKNLIEKGKADPVLTNCYVGKAAVLYDFFRFGGITYALQYAELVRQQSDPQKWKNVRKKWMRTLKNVSKSILNGTFQKEGIDKFFEQTGLSRKEILTHIEKQLEQDPNKKTILQNRSYFLK